MPEFHLHLLEPYGQSHIEDLRHNWSQWLKAEGVSPDGTYAAMSVVDEMVCNLMEHSGAGWVELKAWSTAGRIHVSLRDNGKLFDPTEAMKKDYSAYLKSDTDRKLGLYLAGKLTEGLRYKTEEPEGFNCVTFRLKFKDAAATD